MAKRPSLFSTPRATNSGDSNQAVDNAPAATGAVGASDGRPASRAGKRVLSIYLDPLAWKQLRQLALDSETTTQALGEEAVNLLFAKHGLNRSA
jgi:hypothetical protein